jgi:signal transduction histidine kinase
MLRTVAAFTALVALAAFVQNHFVLGLRLRPIMFVIPALVGMLAGALVASVREARARERATGRQLAAAQARRLDEIARLAGGMGHDLNNLFTVAGACSGALRGAAPEGGVAGGERASALDDLDAALGRARDLSRQLVALARPVRALAAPVDAAAVVRGLEPVLRRGAPAGVRLEVDAPAAAPARIDRTELEQVILNLAANAGDAMPRGGTLSVRVAGERERVVLSVRDEGTGMDERTRARMFEPFFTTKAEGKGTGLGLMVVAHVVERAGGAIAVRSAPGEGTEVSVSLPAGDRAELVRAAPARVGVHAG